MPHDLPPWQVVGPLAHGTWLEAGKWSQAKDGCVLPPRHRVLERNFGERPGSSVCRETKTAGLDVPKSAQGGLLAVYVVIPVSQKGIRHLLFAAFTVV